MNLSFHHVGIAASDPDRTIAFFCTLLDGRTEPGPGHTLVVAGGVRLAIVARRDGEPTTRAHGDHFALSVPAADRALLFERIVALGVPHEDLRGRLYVLDPDGATVELLFE